MLSTSMNHGITPEVAPLDPQAAKLLAYEENPKHKIVVGKKLHSPHPFVAAARQDLQKVEPDKLTHLMPRHIDRLYVAVGKASVPRALLILDALLKALERRKFLVRMEDGMVQVTILDEVFLFGVDERRKQVLPVLNQIQKTQKALNPALYTGRSYQLTGLLNLKQFSQWGRSPWVILSDNEKHKLEDCLNSFIVKLIHEAMERKAVRLERQRQEGEHRRAEEFCSFPLRHHRRGRTRPGKIDPAVAAQVS